MNYVTLKKKGKLIMTIALDDRMAISGMPNKTSQINFGMKLFGKKELSKFAKIAQDIKENYLVEGISESLLKNTHADGVKLHDYSGEPIDLNAARQLLDSLVAEIDKECKKLLMITDAFTWLEKFCEDFHKYEKIAKDTSLSESTRDAIIVDFLTRMSKRGLGYDFDFATKYLNKVPGRK